MSDSPSSNNSDDPDFKPTVNILKTLPLPSDRQTRARNRTDNHIRSKILIILIVD